MKNDGLAKAKDNTIKVADANNNLPEGGIAEEISFAPVNEKEDWIRGDKKAKVAIITYSDFECPFCKKFHETMLQVMNKYDGDVKWVFRHFPLDSLHRQARSEALAGECAGEQGKFWEFADLIFSRTTSNDGLDLTKLPDYAKEIGLNVSKFNSCYESKKYADEVNADASDAQKAGARGTPYSIVVGPNGEATPLSGALPVESVSSILDSLLK